MAEATLIPAPDMITPIEIIGRLNPNTTMIEPKVASPNETDIVIFLPKLSEMKEKTINPSKDPKYGQVLIISKRNSSSHMKGP